MNKEELLAKLYPHPTELVHEPFRRISDPESSISHNLPFTERLRMRSVGDRDKRQELLDLMPLEDLEEARLREKQIQGWTREKKLKLINGQWKKY